MKQFILLCLVPLYLHSQFESAFDIDEPMRLRKVQQILMSFGNKADSSNTKDRLNNLKYLSLKYKDEQCLMLAELYEIRSEKYISSSAKDSAINRIQQIIQNAIEKEYILIQIHGFFEMASLLAKLNRNGASLSYFWKAYELLPKTDTSYLPRSMSSIDFYLGSTFYKLQDYNKARYFIERYFETKNFRPGTHYTMLLHDLLSQIYLKLALYDSSAYQIERAKQIYLMNDTSNWYFKGWNGIFEGNLAKVHYYKKEYENAIPGFIKAIQITSDANMNDNAGSYGLQLADCYLHLGQISKARELIPLIKKSLYKKEDEQNYRDFYRLLFLLRNPTSPLEFTDKLLDSIQLWDNKLKARIDTNTQVIKAMESENLYWKKKKQDLEDKIQRHVTNRKVILLALGIILILSCFLIYNKEKQIHRQRKLTTEISLQATHDLEYAKQQLLIFKNTLIEKNQKIELIETNLDRNQTNLDLEKLKSNTILSEEDWIRFKNIFEKVHEGYLIRLIQKYPELTSGEIRVIVLIKLSLHNKEMASTLGVSTGAIRTMKSRLLKKLYLSESDSLDKIVENI